MAGDSILLRNGNDLVGFAKYVFMARTFTPSSVIHGHPLNQFAKKGEDLVAIHSIQIFKEFEEQLYPYRYKGFEDPPLTLGDLNKIEKAFKHIIAWDRNKIVPNPRASITKLGTTPREVSVELINSIRDSLPTSPNKVRFSEQVIRCIGTNSGSARKVLKPSQTRYRSVLRCLMAEDNRNNESDSAVFSQDLMEESIDQFADELDAEEARGSSDILEIDDVRNRDSDYCSNNISPKHFEESVDQFELELDAEEEEEERCRKASSGDDSADGVATEDNEETPEADLSVVRGGGHEQGTPSKGKKRKKWTPRDSVFPQNQLSPGEKIIRSLRRRKRNRQDREQSDSDDDSSAQPRRVRTRTSIGSDKLVESQLDFDDALEGSASISYQNTSLPSAVRSSGDSGRDRAKTTAGLPRGGSSKLSNEQSGRNSLLNFKGPMNGLNGQGFRVASVVGSGDSCVYGGEVDFSVALSLKNRVYRLNKRVKAQPKRKSQFRKNFELLVQRSIDENPFEKMRSCCNAACFFNVNPEYAVVQYRKILLMDRPEKKRALRSMYNANTNEFWFDGLQVCSRFLCKGFHFSNQLQSAVKGTPGARARASITACPRDSSRETKKSEIIVYLRDLEDGIGNFLPTKSHINLPLLTKNQVYERFCRKYFHDPAVEAPSKSYFYRVWGQNCSDINTHRHHGFTVCGTCERIRAGLAANEIDRVQGVLRQQMDEHYGLMDAERRGYEARRNLSKVYTEKYCSLIVDGADQKGYGLPHYIFNSKDEKGHKLKVRCIGVLMHEAEKQLSLYTLTEEFESGANHVIEAVHRVLNEKRNHLGRLPEVLFVQADNCTRENKNHFFMAYFQMLVAQGVFLEVQISFLPIGHTHADIDQCFSSVANRLRLVDAIIIEDMLQELRNCYTPRAVAEEMTQVANFSGLCKSSCCLFKVKGFSKYRYFRFTRRKAAGFSSEQQIEDSRDGFQTTCDVKLQVQDEWMPLDVFKNRNGFLRFIPNLKDLPVTETTPPDNVLEVNKHIRSCEPRMKTNENLQRLEALRDRVYTRRVDAPHWNLDTTFELNGDYRDSNPINCDASAAIEDSCEQIRLEQLSYSLNFYLAVKTDSRCQDPFWIARTLWIAEKDEEDKALKLKIRWYQARKGSGEAFSAMYDMATYIRHGEQVLFDDVVDVRSVLCEFESLTSKGGLHSRTQKAIRQSLGMD